MSTESQQPGFLLDSAKELLCDCVQSVSHTGLCPRSMTDTQCPLHSPTPFSPLGLTVGVDPSQRRGHYNHPFSACLSQRCDYYHITPLHSLQSPHHITSQCFVSFPHISLLPSSLLRGRSHISPSITSAFLLKFSLTMTFTPLSSVPLSLPPPR